MDMETETCESFNFRTPERCNFRTPERLRGELVRHQRLAVAVSGGVDSAVLLLAAKETLGAANLLALTAVSETLSVEDLRDAKSLAQSLGITHLFVETDELDRPDFSENSPERCYICKRYRFAKLLSEASAHGFTTVADGENTDDMDDHRPGRRAARELGVISPLADAGISKAEVREIARSFGLREWNKPSSACLASRIPLHLSIDREKLARIDVAERFLKSIDGVTQVRVRMDREDTARIEVDPDAIVRLCSAEIRERIVARLRESGFRYVSLDLEGYRTGSLNPK